MENQYWWCCLHEISLRPHTYYKGQYDNGYGGFSLLLIWSYRHSKTDSEKKATISLLVIKFVWINQWNSSAQKRYNDSRANVQSRNNKEHERHFIRGLSTGWGQLLCIHLWDNISPCVSAKALQLQWEGGQWLCSKEIWGGGGRLMRS